MAALAAQEQGRFWEYHDKLFDGGGGKLKRDNLLGYARELGLDMGRFEKALLNPSYKKTIDSDAAEAMSLGATGTPAFFINGRYVSGAKPFETFAGVINAELERLGLPVPVEAKTGG